jgi:hypothetical protein
MKVRNAASMNSWERASQRPGSSLTREFELVPPRQGADILRMKKAIDKAMKQMENPVHGNN